MGQILTTFGARTATIYSGTAADQNIRAQIQLQVPWRLTMVAFDAYTPTYPYPLATDTARPIHWRGVACKGQLSNGTQITPGADTLGVTGTITQRINDVVGDPNRAVIFTWPDIFSAPIIGAGEYFTAAIGPIINADGTINTLGIGSITVWGQPLDDPFLKNLRLR